MTTTKKKNAVTTDERVRKPTLALAVLCLATGCARVDAPTSSRGSDEPALAELHANAVVGRSDELLALAGQCEDGDDVIRGTDFNRQRLTGNRIKLKPVDLQTTPIAAQVERDGGFDVHPGVGKADGTFTIDNVPHGSRYWLGVGKTWYLTRERVVDVGVDALGRPDAIGATAGTSLVFDVDGLTAVTSGDDFQLEAPDAQVGYYSTANNINAMTANAPHAGDTVLAGAVFPFDANVAAGTTQFPLIQASQGDTLTLAQLTTLQAGSVTYQSLSRALTTSVEMIQGAATTIHGSLTTPPPVVTNTDFQQAAFEALANDIHPGSVPTGSSIAIDASPAGRRVNSGTPDLVVASLPAASGNHVVPFQYRNPYPASWPLFAVSSTSFQVPFVGVAADGTPTARQTTSTTLSWEFVADGSLRMAPVVSPAREISINGQPASDQIQTTTATPVLTWERPRHGLPAAYAIRIVHVIADAPYAVTGIGRLVLPPDVERVRIPAGVLQSGEHYYFQVIAIASSEPRRRGELDIMFVPPHAAAMDAFSGTIRIE
jgi:hypothetical protein